MMKHFAIAFIMAVFLLVPLCNIASAETYIPSRTINLVYDDSISMIYTESGYVDTWCQAKYAMEVFAAMLGEKDTLNLYYMSDYVGGKNPAPKLSLQGSRDASVTMANVSKIHNLVTSCSNTPFDAVHKACVDLLYASSDERWLVVLTDGEFNNASNLDVEEYFHVCVENKNMKVAMLSMGPNAAIITPAEDLGIYFERATTTKDILGKLTKICNQIFQNNTLSIDKTNLTSSFNVPMSELIIFAQGKNVKIESIKDENGNIFTPKSNVSVVYSSVATTNKNVQTKNVIVDDNLMGYVATFDADFKPGTYTFNVSGSDDIQVYYKPNVSIAAYLYNGDTEVTSEENLVAGTYRLEFGFVNGITGEKVTDTALLGNIEYKADIVNTTAKGDTNQIEAVAGDSLTIKEGKIDINVVAKFLDYNTVHTKLSYDIFNHCNLIFNFEEKPKYLLTLDGFTNSDAPLILKVKINDGEATGDLTLEQWSLLGTPQITTKSKLGDFKIEKTDEIGTYKVYPTLKDEDALNTDSGVISLNVTGGFTQGLSSADGTLEDTFEIETTITANERFKAWLQKNGLKLLVCLIILALILGYMPPIKKYLPRKLRQRPLIECSAEKIGQKDREAHGKYKRKLYSTLIPYKSETGFVTFSPSPYKKTAQLRAAGGHGMYITNTKVFAGKEEITFNGMPIEENRIKPYRISSGSTISLRTPEYTYTCYLNR